MCTGLEALLPEIFGGAAAEGAVGAGLGAGIGGAEFGAALPELSMGVGAVGAPAILPETMLSMGEGAGLGLGGAGLAGASYGDSLSGLDPLTSNFGVGAVGTPSLAGGLEGYNFPVEDMFGNSGTANLESSFAGMPETAGEYVPSASDYANGGSSNGVYGQQSLGDMFSTATDFMTSPIGGNKLGLTPIQGLGSLYDYTGKQKMAQAQLNRYNQVNSQIDNSYAPGSAEYEQMRKELAAKDAANGRNSQYGNRAVQLQAAIAKIKGDQRNGAMSGQNTLLNQGLQNENTGLSSLFGYMGKNSSQQGLQDLLKNSRNPINITL